MNALGKLVSAAPTEETLLFLLLMENSSLLYNNLTPFLHLPVCCAEALQEGEKGVRRGVEAGRRAVGQA